MQTLAYGITGTTYATWPVTPWKCIDCHDPHWDANNAMVRSGINAPNSGSDTLAGSAAKGRPQRTGADVHAITFTDNSGYAANSYAVPGAGSWGICEVCHTRTAAYAATGTATDNAGTHGSRTGNCSTCHSHAQGFKGACNICPSYPGQDNTGTNLKQMSRGHWDHAGDPVGGTANSRNFACEYFEEWDEPQISGIRWVSELVGIAGGDDVFPELAACGLGRDRIIADPLEVLRRAPDIILGSWCGKKFRPAAVAARSGWERVPAVATGQLHEIKSSLILQPGPAALTDGIAAIREVIARWQEHRDRDAQ